MLSKEFFLCVRVQTIMDKHLLKNSIKGFKSSANLGFLFWTLLIKQFGQMIQIHILTGSNTFLFVPSSFCADLHN